MPACAAPAIVAAGDRRRTAFSLTRSGPEGSSRNEFQAGSSAGLLPPTGRAARRALRAEGRRCTDERGRRRLSRARAQVPAVELRRPDRPGPPRAHAEQRHRDGPPGPRLAADGRARGGQDLDGADHRARAQLHRRGRGGRPDARAMRHVRSLRLDRRGPPRRRDRDGRGLAHRHRRRARADRGRALPPGLGALQGLHHRRSAHALEAGLQRAAQDARGAAAPRQIRVRDDRGAAPAGNGALALPALRSAPGRHGGV